MKNKTTNDQSLIAGRSRSAFVGAAVGDALGWPFEGRAVSLPKNAENLGYIDWKKKSGGRFNPHLEYIAAGNYSDDTQLLLATGRSLTTQTEWWKNFAEIELPFWTTYERGGGGATKRAAALWVTGSAPWLTEKGELSVKYFEAGGNGVAMRVLPHCVGSASESSFRDTASAIFANGVTTHGHPRALAGALAYGYCCWQALRLSETLEYGYLIQQALDRCDEWSVMPDISAYWPTWKGAALNYVPDYLDQWEIAVNEMISLLKIALSAMHKGALVSQRSILEELGAYNKKIGGAGTVSAASAIFMASRYAASPLEGLINAATAVGTDTDTIASMTGAILGAVNGQEWLSKFRNGTQDIDNLEYMANTVATGNYSSNDQELRAPITKSVLQKFSKELESNPQSIQILPNGLKIERISKINPESDKEKNLVILWKIESINGPTFYFKKSIRSQKDDNAQKKFPTEVETVNSSEFTVSSIGISLKVSDVMRSRNFYETVLGLQVTGHSSKSIRFGTVLALKEDAEKLPSTTAIRIFLQVSNILSCYKKMLDHCIEVKALNDQGKVRVFECIDPDGYIIEIFERS